MGADDKTANAMDKLRGDTKEKVGKATGDDALRRQGGREKSKSDLTQAGEKVKDAVRH